MNAGQLLIWAAVLVSIISVLQNVAIVKGHVALRGWARRTWWFLAVLLLLAFLDLVYLFATNDVDYLYVWNRSSSDLDLMYRLGASFSGAGGSTLLTTILMMVIMGFFLYRNDRDGERKDLLLASMAASLVVFGFVLIVLMSDIFAPTVPDSDAAWRLVQNPDGLGLTPALQTWEMVLHPIVVFLGYAACLVPFTMAAAQMRTGDRDLSSVMNYARFAWLMISLGIAVGAWWSYYEVGWGGYWGWDPVETSSLILWVVLSAFLHVGKGGGVLQGRSMSVQLLAYSTFLTVAFTIFVTRSGRVWAFAVHTYSSSEAGDTGSRLSAVLGEGTVLLLFVMLLVMIAVMVWLAWSAKREKLEDRDLTDMPALALGAFLVVIITLLALLFKNVDANMISNYTEMTEKVPLVFALLALVLTFCMLAPRLGKKMSYVLLTVMASIVLLTGLYAWSADWDPFLTATVPVFLMALLAGSAWLVILIRSRRGRVRWRSLGSALVHMGTMLILIAYVISTSFQSAPATGDRNPLNVGDSIEMNGYTIRLVDVNMGTHVPEPSHNYNVTWTIVLEVTHDGNVMVSDLELRNLYLENEGETRKVDGQVVVLNTLAEDLYLEFDLDPVSDITLSSKTVPLMMVLWLGAFMLNFGIVMALVAARPSK